jgi:hypothetical protein
MLSFPPPPSYKGFICRGFIADIISDIIAIDVLSFLRPLLQLNWSIQQSSHWRIGG